MKKYIIASTVLGILILVYMGFPYYCTYKLFISLKKGDRYELEKYINFESVRSSLKEQVNALLLGQFASDKEFQDNPFSGLAMVFMPKLADSIIDAYLTPSGISALIRRGKLESKVNQAQESIRTQAEDKEEIDFWQVFSKANYAFFTNPSTFLVEIEGVKLKLKLQEWSWRLTNIYLPNGAIIHRPIAKDEDVDKGNKRLSFKDLSGSFVNSPKVGKLFVVKGWVTNKYPDRRNFIRVKSNILDSEQAVVSSRIVYAGHPLTDNEFQSLPMEEIDKRLRDKLGKNKMNTNILPNASIPFVIVFNNLPQDMGEFTVEAISSSSSGK